MTRFENLQNDIEQSSLSSERKERILHQHISVRQKIFSLEEYKNELLSFETVKFFEAMVSQSQTSTSSEVTAPELQSQLQLPDNLKLTFQLLRILDGFLANAKSVFDTFAREVYWLYEGEPISDIYFATMPLPEIKAKQPDSLLWDEINRVKQELWYQYLDTLRSSTLHESIIATRVNIQLDPLTKTIPISNIYLPDDPRVWPITHEKQKDLKSFVQQTFEGVIQFLEKAAVTVKNDLPNIT